MTWENCHEHFLAAPFRAARPDLAATLDRLAAAVAANDRPARKAAGRALLAAAGAAPAPGLVADLTCPPAALEAALAALPWIPRRVFLTADAGGVSATAVR